MSDPSKPTLDEWGWTEAQRDAAVEGLRTERNLRVACDKAGLSISMLRKRQKGDPAFAADCAEARNEWIDRISQATLHDASEGFVETRVEYEHGDETKRIETHKIDNALRLAVLARWDPERWGKRETVELDVKSGVLVAPAQVPAEEWVARESARADAPDPAPEK